jgi:hypothetical protein
MQRPGTEDVDIAEVQVQMRGCRGTGTEEVDSRGPGADEKMQRHRYRGSR